MTTITANINKAGQRKRLIGGIVSIVIGLLLLALLHQADAGRWWRLLVFPSFWLGALGVIQAQARTCVAFAAAGVCELEDGTRQPLDSKTAALFKLRAKTINVGALALAVAATMLALL